MPVISNTELSKLRTSIEANNAKIDAVRVEAAKQRESIDALAVEGSKQRGKIEALVLGLDAVVSTLTNHTSMLKALMVAAAPDEDGSPLHDVLQRLANALEKQVEAIERIEVALDIAPAPEPPPPVPVSSPYANSANPANVTTPANADA